MKYLVKARSTTQTTGAGNLTLDGPATGYLSLHIVGTGEWIPYFLEDANGTDWESGVGQIVDVGAGVYELQTRTVTKSTNSDAAINLSTGTHKVTLGVPAEVFGRPYAKFSVPGNSLPDSIWTAITLQTPDSDYDPFGGLWWDSHSSTVIIPKVWASTVRISGVVRVAATPSEAGRWLVRVSIGGTVVDGIEFDRPGDTANAVNLPFDVTAVFTGGWTDSAMVEVFRDGVTGSIDTAGTKILVEVLA